MAKKSARDSAFDVLAGLDKAGDAEPVDTVRDIVSIGRARATRMGLVMDEATNRPAWLNIGRDLSVAADGIQWAIGDWLNFGEHKWGDTYKEAEEITGFTKGHLRNLKMYAEAYDLSSRNDKLSFKHHVTVYRHPERDSLLDEAAEKGWSTAELAKQARLMLPGGGGDSPEWKRFLREMRGRAATVAARPKKDRRKIAAQLQEWSQLIIDGEELPEIE